MSFTDDGLLVGTLHGHALVSHFYLQTIEANIRVLFLDEVSSGSRGRWLKSHIKSL